jgi:hypothetical protein
MRIISVLLLACMAMLMLSATGAEADRALQTHSVDDEVQVSTTRRQPTARR